MKGNRLYKYEKLCSRKLIDQMFALKNNSIKSYPLRLIYTISDDNGTPAKFFISVPKRRFKHAVQRVLMRRRIREAYRLNRNLLFPVLKETGKSVNISMLMIGDSITPSHVIDEHMKIALTTLADVVKNSDNNIACE
ncbi:MAG: ribonuclease P protein component [Muribaculaceae bacterium]